MAQALPVALVTGSGRRRVGNVIARSLAKAGYAIALHYHRSAKAASETVDEIEKLGVACQAFQADLGVEAEANDLVDAVVDRFKRIDVLVTTASIWDAVPLEDVTTEVLVRNFQVNTLGTFFCARRAGLAMCQQPEGGSITVIGDWAIQRPYRDFIAYFISKGTIPTMTRALAVELAHRNPRVRVNCIHPGPVMIPPDTVDSEREMLIESTLTKTADCPEAVAQAVHFFVQNRFVTGTCLPVDGGRSIYSPESETRQRPI
jgi:pteridine reductase